MILFFYFGENHENLKKWLRCNEEHEEEESVPNEHSLFIASKLCEVIDYK